MVKFRLHRGSLKDSLETVKEVTSLDEVKEIVKLERFTVGDLHCKYCGFDERIGWDTWLVLEDNNVPVGFCNAEIPLLTPPLPLE